MSKPKERVTYREDEPLGSNVWVEFEHPLLPEGYLVERVTTHRIKHKCGRFHVSWAVWDRKLLDNLSCPHCDEGEA